MAIDFRCFYCGQMKPKSESSGEHIIPSSIGGTKNGTFTDQVCAACNKFAGYEVDLPFSRDFFIAAARLIAGIKHRGKRPALFMGTVTWDRPERLEVHQLESGASIFVIDGGDGVRRLGVALDESDPEMVAAVQNVIKNRFAGMRVVNDESPHTQYELELASGLERLGQKLNVANSISIVAWHRELVKMALGLSCLTFGDAYITSAHANVLRTFLREPDPDKRARIPVRGTVGIAPNTTPAITGFWHPGGEEHLFALIQAGSGGVAFVANLFGKYENTVEVDPGGSYASMLPGTILKGVCWVIDGNSKQTKGPAPVEQVMLAATRGRP